LDSLKIQQPINATDAIHPAYPVMESDMKIVLHAQMEASYIEANAYQHAHYITLEIQPSIPA